MRLLLVPLAFMVAACGPDVSVTKRTFDNDSDGYSSEVDCDDTHATINPDAPEMCDGVDNDCDALIDDDAMDAPTWYADTDGDGSGDDAATATACDVPEGFTETAGDCDDTDATAFPGADEACDGVDDDCDGAVDEDAVDAVTGYLDEDGDGYGDPAVAYEGCELPDGYVADGTDCDDVRIDIHPDAAEDDCADATDYNCDGSAAYADADGDGVAACEDCDDADPSRSPLLPELCDVDDMDEDCDGAADDADEAEDAITWARDRDGDGYGDPAGPAVSACDQPAGYAVDATDCDDYDLGANPGAMEVCDAADTDEDCDGTSDDNDASTDASTWTTWYRDLDADGYGDTSRTVSQCEAPTGYLADATDCDDAEATVHPGAAELCDDADIDEDCDGLANDDDGDVAGTTAWYRDADADGWGTGIGVDACESPPGWADTDGDCDDSTATISPAARETCNGRDDDCDGLADADDPSVSGLATWFADVDGDAYGDAASAIDDCSAPSGYVADATDCDDAVDTTYPGADERCNAEDDDCDGTVDGDGAVDATAYYIDADADGHGDPATRVTSCFALTDLITDNTDCDDTAFQVNPGEPEVCDEVDNDCDGLVDDDDSTLASSTADLWYVDGDGDTYGDALVWTAACVQPAGHVADATDCDDADATANPGEGEVCDGVDNDCNGSTDDDASDQSAWYADGDGDGYGAGASMLACTAPVGSVAATDDCDDSDAAVNPGEVEVCDNGVDDDCDGTPGSCGVEDRGLADADARYNGEAAGDWAGVFVSAAGDVNADGYDDMLFGAPGNDDGAFNAGAAYLVLGSAAPASASLSFALEYTGEAASDIAGYSVSGAGDVNADGYDDIIVGGRFNDEGGSNAGAAYLLLGSAAPASRGLASASAKYTGEAANDDAGYSSSGAGDVDGDGFDDILVGAYFNNDGPGSYAGAAYLVLGSSSPASHSLSSASAQYTGEADSDCAGISVSSAGDVDADGYDDFLIGAYYSDDAGFQAGAAYLMLGGEPASQSLSSASAKYTGEAPRQYAGGHVTGAGDMNADGYADVLIGTQGSGAYLVLGVASPVSQSLADASAHYALDDLSSSEDETAVSGAGDIDADGYVDVLFGVSLDDDSGSNAGSVYLVLGSSAPASQSLGDADAQFTGEAADDYAGVSVSEAGDVDGDGFGDLLIGAYWNDASATNAGSGYLIRGGGL